MTIPKVGEMKHVFKFELPNKSEDNTSGQHEQYLDWFTCRGLYREMSASRRFQSGYDTAVAAGEMFVQWRQEIENQVCKDMRIVYDNRFFSVDNYRLVGEKRRIYLFEVKSAR